MIHQLKYWPLVVVLSCVPTAVFGDVVRFNSDVRPVLSSKCFSCHGPDEHQREADLRFDTEEGIQQAFEGGIENSVAWERIVSDDEYMVMPPPDSHLELKPREREIVKQWIEQGARWEGHWSFNPVIKPEVPQLENSPAALAPIDAFILERLQRDRFGFSDEAEKARLLRRVTFDLTGLPPTLEEIDAFLADDSSDAYEKVVDRLLNSPHYGERMTLMWMDAARYGDSSVFHADGPRDMWKWRDWVIEAYNGNKPFDEFTVEQLAGDLLPDATVEQKLATGFLRNNATTDEGGAIAEEFRVEYAVDRVKTTSMIWLGLSMECAQCHSHKYDPISQEDYYSFFAFFNQSADPGMQTRRGNQSPIVNIYDPEKMSTADVLKQELATLEETRKKHRSDAKPRFEEWLVTASKAVGDAPALPAAPNSHFTLDETKGKAVSGFGPIDEERGEPAKLHGSVEGKANWVPGHTHNGFKSDGNSYLKLGSVGDYEHDQAFSYGCWVKPEGAGNGAPLAKMDDQNGNRGYDIHIASGVIQVHIINKWPENALKVRTKNKLKPNDWNHLFVTYDGTSKVDGLQVYLNGQVQKVDIERNQLNGSIRSQVPLQVGRRTPGSPFTGIVDEVFVYDRVLAESEVKQLADVDAITPLLAKESAERTPEELETLEEHYFAVEDTKHKQLSDDIAKLNKKIETLTKPVTTVMVMQDVAKMRPTYVLERGDYASPNKEKEVHPGFPAALTWEGSQSAARNRLDMAKWLVDERHPLTARVTVNRYWAMLFGRGIVETMEDFGSQGAWPSHPKLLDWLAADFVEHGWDVKRMIKQMVMSRTYRQSSRTTSEVYAYDPENRLFARGPRFRLAGEFIRDNALATSGLLVKTIGGPGVKPYQPEGLWNEVSLSGNVRFVQDKGEKLYRRSMYTYWKRSAPAPFLTLFDAPTREKCTLRRGRTNTPLQALVTLNDPQYTEASRALAQRAMLEGGETIEEQISYAYRLATGQKPKPFVLDVLQESYLEELETFRADPSKAESLLAIGESPRDESIDKARHAAMSIVTKMIYNLDETLTRG